MENGYSHQPICRVQFAKCIIPSGCSARGSPRGASRPTRWLPRRSISQALLQSVRPSLVKLEAPRPGSYQCTLLVAGLPLQRNLSWQFKTLLGIFYFLPLTSFNRASFQFDLCWCVRLVQLKVFLCTCLLT